MPKSFAQENAISLKFGGGVNSTASPDEIDPRECSEGANFDLDLKNRNFKPRKPFDLVGTVPNASQINGFANLVKTDGTASVLIQAGTTVYEWDGATTFTAKGSPVSASAKLRGPLSQNWLLDNKVIITDISLTEPVMQWDGTTLSDVAFTKNDGSTAWTGAFKAKYCAIDNERALFCNVDDNSVALPHLIVGSERGNFSILSNNNRPSSARSEEDSFYLIQPDYRPINGLALGFGRTVTSSKDGALFELTGSTAKDFSFEQLYPRSGASGDEAVTNIGNDILYGRPGRIESLFATERFGDVEANDVTTEIFDLIKDFTDWTIVYNSRVQRVYCVSASTSQVWVLHKPLMGSGLSPWMKWTTDHTMAFQPTAMMNMVDPSDGLEYVFFGDSSGNFYRMEGTGSSGDGGTTNVTAERLSGLISAPLDAEMYDINGWIKYLSGQSVDVEIINEYSGFESFNDQATITIPEVTTNAVYNGAVYYGGSYYYGVAAGKIKKQKITIPGQASDFQIRAKVTSSNDFEINEIGQRYNATT